ncbi:MAG: hypothetical protein ACKVS8_11010 [Phycisphaerales bacterium]
MATKSQTRTHSFTLRQEANAITCGAFRNGFLEDLHAGKSSPLTDDPNLSRLTNAEMKALMIEASSLVARMLALKEQNPEKYWEQIRFLHESYTHNWVQDEIHPDTPSEQLRCPLRR